MKRQIIVVTGMGGDSAVRKICRIIQRWNDKSNRVVLFDSQWESAESYPDKYKRLLDFYDSLDSNEISVVAYSAGGALAVRLLAERSNINKLVIVQLYWAMV